MEKIILTLPSLLIKLREMYYVFVAAQFIGRPLNRPINWAATPLRQVCFEISTHAKLSLVRGGS